MLGEIKGWFLALTVGKKIAVAAASTVTALTTAGVVMPVQENQPQNPPVEPVTQSVEIKKVTELEAIKCKTKKIKDEFLDKGDTEVQQECINGEKEITYEVTLTDGTETDRKLISEEVVKKAQDKIVAIGTYEAPEVTLPPPPSTNCDPNYSGCVPIASDVDCAGGSGNGPAYVSGPITVIGSDIYGLDRDGDGIACE